jgi:NAD(P)-dependent dehydrogenase (short-subunit alcohol dehydrogenase family)
MISGLMTKVATREPLGGLARRVLITGASRGIGLALTRLFAVRGWHVIPLVRSTNGMEETLFELNRYVVADLSDLDGIPQCVNPVSVGAIDVLLHVAGDFGNGAFRFLNFDHEAWQQTIRTNLLGPAILSQHLVENIAASKEKKIVFLSTGNASISGNQTGEMLAYRTSKTALNQLCRTMAHEIADRGLIAVCVDPGWVRTRMGGNDAPLSPAESAENLYSFIEGLKAEHSGTYLSTDFYALPY